MAKINLLPWRQELREKKQQDFLIAMGAGVAVTCVLFGLVYLQIESQKEFQTSRNQRVNDEIAAVNKKIEVIKDIEEKKTKLSAKIDLIQQLQESRPAIVHLFDELRKVTPSGVYLSSLTQAGAQLTVNGKAQANSMVSDYMRAIDKSEWVTDPKLGFVRGGTSGAVKDENNDFTMTFKQKDKPKVNPEDNPEGQATDETGAK